VGPLCLTPVCAYLISIEQIEITVLISVFEGFSESFPVAGSYGGGPNGSGCLWGGTKSFWVWRGPGRSGLSGRVGSSRFYCKNQVVLGFKGGGRSV